MSILNDILDTVFSIAPEKRFATLQVQTSAALLVERVNDSGDFLEAQMSVAAAGYPTVAAVKIAAVS
jgi:hypothetical protein